MSRFPVIPQFLILIAFVAACSPLNIQDSFKQEILGSVAGKPIPVEDFIYIYEKNNFNNDSIYSENDVRNYLDLFLNFKLKVQQAKEEGIDTTKSFINEFKSYQSELIKPYSLDTRETDSLAGIAYQRLQYFIHASHILTRTEGDDTLKAYDKINNIHAELKNGSDFRQLAQKMSEDPSASKNGGDLGYFTAFKMVYPFENAAYSTQVGEISKPFRTQFGYHIVKVHDKEPNKGKVKIAHLVVRKNETDSANSENKIFEIYDKLETGGDWDYLCKQFSEDEKTRENGGVLNFFGQGQLPVEFKNFEDEAFSLQTPGEIGGPIETPFGWHIIKLIEKMPPENFEDQKDFIYRQLSRGDRQQNKKEVVISRLKKESGFQESEVTLSALLEIVDSAILEGTWMPNLPDSSKGEILFEIDGKPFPISSFIPYLNRNHVNSKNYNPKDYFKLQYDNFVEAKLYEYEQEKISKENFEYRMLEREYFEGLLLFEVMEKYVWAKSSEDTLKLNEYYKENRDKYKWGKRIKACIVSTDNPDLMQEISGLLKSDSIAYSEVPLSLDDEAHLSEDANKEIEKIGLECLKVPESVLKIEYNPERISFSSLIKIVDQFAGHGIPNKKIITIANKELSLPLNFTLISLSKKALEYRYNINSTLTVKVEEGLFEEGENAVTDQIEWKVGISEWNDGERHYLVKVDEILDESFKNLNEIRGSVISDYQIELEKEWIHSLKARYTVTINEEVLNKMIKYFEKK